LVSSICYKNGIFGKKGERFFKIWFRGKDPDGLSAIEPQQYQRRFMNRMREIIQDEQRFLDNSSVDEKVFKKKTFEVHIWPAPEKVQDNLVEALQSRTTEARKGLRKHLTAPCKSSRWKRPRMMSTPDKRSMRESDFRESRRGRDTMRSLMWKRSEGNYRKIDVGHGL